jgi:hypothetical protein
MFTNLYVLEDFGSGSDSGLGTPYWQSVQHLFCDVQECPEDGNAFRGIGPRDTTIGASAAQPWSWGSNGCEIKRRGGEGSCSTSWRSLCNADRSASSGGCCREWWILPTGCWLRGR